MDAATIIETIAKVLKTVVDLTPTIIKGVEDAKPFATEIYHLLAGGGTVTEAELDALEAKVDALSDQLQAPLPDDVA